MAERLLIVGRDGTLERNLTGPEIIERNAARAARVIEKRPKQMTKVQVAQHLRGTGKWNMVRGRIASAGTTAREDWELSNVVKRSDPIVIEFGLNQAELNAMFDSVA